MGLYIGIHASHTDSVVLHIKLFSYSSLPFRNDCYDHVENPTQGYCQIQSGNLIGIRNQYH